jgi:cytochrome P450
VTTQVHSDRSLSIYNLISRAESADARILFSRLSQEDPVHWDPYAGVWLVADRSAAERVFTGDEFSALRTLDAQRRDGEAPVDEVYARTRDIIARQALFLDGELHSAWRRILRLVLAASRVDALGPWIEARIAELAAAGDGGQLDIVGELARLLPLEVTCRLLGVPSDDLAAMSAWSDAYTYIVTGFGPVADTDVHARVVEFMDYSLDLVRRHRRYLADDGLSILIAEADKTGLFTDDDIAANFVMLIAAGHQTTAGFLAGSVLERLCPTFGPMAVRDTPGDEAEELLARVSPSRFVGRLVTQDVELAGRQLKAGQTVLVLLAAVNWRALADGRTDSAPAGSKNIAFGYGRHRCPGDRLAHLEGRLVLEHLFAADSVPTLLDDQTPWSDNVNLPCPLRVLVSLPRPMKGDPQS